MSPRVAIGLAWVTLVWGTGWLVIKLALVSFAPLFLAGSRFVIAAILLWLLARSAGPLPRGRRDLLALFGSGALMAAICPGLVFWGQVRIPSGLASLLFAGTPLFTALLANRFLPGERLTRQRLTGIIVGLAGVAVVCVGGIRSDTLGTSPDFVAGSAAVIASTVAFAAGLVWLKRIGTETHPLATVAMQSTAGAVILLPASFVLEPVPFRDVGWFAIVLFAYLTVVQSCVTQSVYIALVREIEATRIAYISCVVPVIAVTVGAIVLDEPLEWTLLIGGAAVIAGLFLVNRAPRSYRVLPAESTADDISQSVDRATATRLSHGGS